MADFDFDDQLNDPDFIISNESGGKYDTKKTCSSSSWDESDSDLCQLPINAQDSTSRKSSEEPHRNSSGLSRKRKNVANPSKQYLRKMRRQHGEEYVSTKGLLQKKREIKPGCSRNCYFLCSELFSENNRQNIFKEFWSLTDSQKNTFYSKFVSVKNVKRRVVRHSTKKQKSFIYHLKKQYNKIIATGVVKELQKGRHIKHAISNETKEKIREHIKSFPVVDSHYCRASTSRQYLEEGLTISKMFRLFQQKFPTQSVSLSTFTGIFKKEFNLGFFVPKKDQCDRCVLFQKQKLHNTLDGKIKQEFEKHCQEKLYCKVDREKDRAIKSNDNLVICFDLQSVFTLPKGLSSIYYYKRKLSVFNMTATVCSQNIKPNITYCAIWNEIHSGRSGNDIASAIVKILHQIANDFKNVKHFILWSDSCIPQNKNQIFSTALLQFMNDQKKFISITQKFSEPGHSQIQEVDAVHSAIDRHLKLREIHGPLDLVELLKTYKSPKVVLIVLEMTRRDFFMYSKKSKLLDFKNVPFSQIKSLQYQKNNLFAIYHKMSLSQKEYMKTDIKKKGRKNVFSTPLDLFKETLQNSPPQKKSSEKVDDVKSLYNFLSLDAVAYYNNLFQIN